MTSPVAHGEGEAVTLLREPDFHEDHSAAWWNAWDMGGMPIPETWSAWKALPVASFDTLIAKARAWDERVCATAPLGDPDQDCVDAVRARVEASFMENGVGFTRGERDARVIVSAYNALLARANTAKVLLKEARGWLAALLKCGTDKAAVDDLLSRLDDALGEG